MKKRIIAIIAAILTFALMAIPAMALDADSDLIYQSNSNVYDEANLLSSSEAKKLAQKIASFNQNHNIDIVVVTLQNLQGNPNTFAENYYDSHGFGSGGSNSGVMLLISMQTRDWVITARGKGLSAFCEEGREYIGEKIQPKLSDGDYYKAFDLFCDLSEDFIVQYENGTPYTADNLPMKPFPVLPFALGSVAVAFIISLIVTAVMKSHLKSVRPQDTAKYYVRPGSLNIVNGYEQFLYSNVTSTKIQSSSDGDGGIHSSGSSSSGKF